VKPPTVLFIGGLGRSGSTLLEQALGELEGVQGLGETVHLWRRGVQLDERCGCGQPFHACGFWTAVGAAAFGGWPALDVARVEWLRATIDRTRYIPLMPVRSWRPRYVALLEEYVGYYRSIYDAVGATTGASVVVDSSKHPSLAYALATGGLDLRVVQVIRDPRAVAHSWTKTVRRPEATSEEGDLMTVYRPSRSALLWDSHNLALRALPRLGTPTLCLRYEDFVAEPEATLRRVMSFAGLDAPALPVHGNRMTVSPQHTVSGNPARFRTGEIRIAASDDWRSALSRPARAVVTTLTLPQLHRYGYPVTDRPAEPR
jgi:hypothetical protein